MKRYNICFLAALAPVILTACAQAPSDGIPAKRPGMPGAVEAPPPPQYKAAVDEAVALGALLKHYDDAAWIATDTADALGILQTAATHGHYVVEPTAGGYRVSFIEQPSEAPLLVGTVDVTQGGMGASDRGTVTAAKVYAPAVTPSPAAAALYEALLSAERAPGLLLCKGPAYNSAVLPYESGGKKEYRVYFMQATSRPKTVPLGGHVLVRVADDAKTILEVSPQSKSCMVADTSDPRVAELGMVNLSLAYPSEVYVFLYWRYGVPIFMSTAVNGIGWEINDKGISVIK